MAHDRDGNYEGLSTAGVNTRIMVAAVVVLFVVVLFILFLHIYARWFWRAARLRAAARGGSGGGRAWSRRFGRRMRFSFRTVDPGAAANGVVVPSKGLDKEVLESLPIFFYTKKDRAAVMEEGGGSEEQEEEEEEVFECAVCLSEFEENEAGRRLPKCGHVFHTECIDMWFSSHSTCPLCRTSVGSDDRDLERGEAAEVLAVEGSHNRSQGEHLLREAVVSGLTSTNSSSSPAVSSTGTTAIAIQILQDEGAILLQEQSGSSSSSGLKGQSPQQQLFPASVLFWGNRSYTNSNSATVGSSSASQHQQQDQHEPTTTTTTTIASPASTPSPKQQRRELIIEVPRRSAANFSSACSSQLPSPNSAEGGSQRSPLGAHLRNIKRLLSRDSRRYSLDTSPSPVGRDCCEPSQYHSACHTPGSITPTSQC